MSKRDTRLASSQTHQEKDMHELRSEYGQPTTSYTSLHVWRLLSCLALPIWLITLLSIQIH